MMTHAIRAGSGWTLLPYGEDVAHEGVTASHATVMLWSNAEREAFGVFAVPEPDAAPAGQIEEGRELVDADGRPAWAVTYRPAEPSLPPDNPTLGDWRVALVLWGRLGDVLARIKALVDAGNPLGVVAQERVEYSNNVLLAQLLQLKDVFGFTEADVIESLWRADRVSKGDLSGVWPLPEAA